MKQIDNLRILNSAPIITPAQLDAIFPIDDTIADTVAEGRKIITDILEGRDSRMLGIVGPCSIHDEGAALEYADRLADLQSRVKDQLVLVMRVYFEKPRTTIGWRGLITDPHLDGSYDIEEGLKLARHLLHEIAGRKLAAATEVLDTIIPQYLSSLISWAAIGARTTESQTHRNMASGLSTHVVFKNGTDGNITTAINALESAMHPHSFLGIDKNGQTCILNTTGNRSVHMILRGGHQGPNYYEEYVETAEKSMKSLGLNPAIIVDCSHANSGKDPHRQERVLRSVVDQRVYGRQSLVGFMIESNLFEGCQKISPDRKAMKYGVSITDPCLGWEDTEKLILSARDRLEQK